MSGAGKSSVLNALEDAGYFCADNVPPPLLDRFALLNARDPHGSGRMAIVVDVRAGELFSQLGDALHRLAEAGCSYQLLFLDAEDRVLLDRYKEGRRRHPMIGGDIVSLPDAIAKERTLLEQARRDADFVIDTSRMTVSVLKTRIRALFSEEVAPMTIECLSFGFKNGLPREADLVFDVRCLPNPYYVPALKHLTGLDKEVRDYVMRFDTSKEMLDRILGLLNFSLPLYASEGKSHLVIAFGCTGGHHRSVTFAECVAKRLSEQYDGVSTVHRDLEKR
jgi:UPF0042 nucleotide-binding protein